MDSDARAAARRKASRTDSSPSPESTSSSVSGGESSPTAQELQSAVPQSPQPISPVASTYSYSSRRLVRLRSPKSQGGQAGSKASADVTSSDTASTSLVSSSVSAPGIQQNAPVSSSLPPSRLTQPPSRLPLWSSSASPPATEKSSTSDRPVSRLTPPPSRLPSWSSSVPPPSSSSTDRFADTSAPVATTTSSLVNLVRPYSPTPSSSSSTTTASEPPISRPTADDAESASPARSTSPLPPPSGMTGLLRPSSRSPRPSPKFAKKKKDGDDKSDSYNRYRGWLHSPETKPWAVLQSSDRYEEHLDSAEEPPPPRRPQPEPDASTRNTELVVSTSGSGESQATTTTASSTAVTSNAGIPHTESKDSSLLSFSSGSAMPASRTENSSSFLSSVQPPSSSNDGDDGSDSASLDYSSSSHHSDLMVAKRQDEVRGHVPGSVQGSSIRVPDATKEVAPQKRGGSLRGKGEQVRGVGATAHVREEMPSKSDTRTGTDQRLSIPKAGVITGQGHDRDHPEYPRGGEEDILAHKRSGEIRPTQHTGKSTGMLGAAVEADARTEIEAKGSRKGGEGETDLQRVAIVAPSLPTGPALAQYQRQGTQQPQDTTFTSEGGSDLAIPTRAERHLSAPKPDTAGTDAARISASTTSPGVVSTSDKFDGMTNKAPELFNAKDQMASAEAVGRQKPVTVPLPARDPQPDEEFPSTELFLALAQGTVEHYPNETLHRASPSLGSAPDERETSLLHVSSASEGPYQDDSDEDAVSMSGYASSISAHADTGSNFGEGLLVSSQLESGETSFVADTRMWDSSEHRLLAERAQGLESNLSTDSTDDDKVLQDDTATDLDSYDLADEVSVAASASSLVDSTSLVSSYHPYNSKRPSLDAIADALFPNVDHDQLLQGFDPESPSLAPSTNKTSFTKKKGPDRLDRCLDRIDSYFSVEKFGILFIVALVAVIVVIGVLYAGPEEVTRQADSAQPSGMPSPAPTLEPTPTLSPTSLTEGLFSFLSDVSFDGGSALRNQTSPQHQAFEWLSNNDLLDTYSSQSRLQRYVMATLFFSTQGGNWSNNNGWLSNDSECSWFSMASRSSPCDGNGIVINLDLDNNNLQGTLPAELGMLSDSLVRIGVSGGPSRRLMGTIPPEIGFLTLLRSLNMRDNDLRGSIPPELGNLDLLGSLDIRNNMLSGSISSEIGLLTNLLFLSLTANGLSGTLPSQLGLLNQLTLLDVSSNHFQAILSEIGNMTGLQTLKMQSNQFSGIPSEIGKLTALRSLDLSSNNIEGSIPSELGQLTELRTLSLSNNLLSGAVPWELGSLIELRGLSLSSNRLAGAIPGSIGGLLGLRFLYFQSNELGGLLPTELAMLTRLNTIRIDSNNFKGEVPISVCAVFNNTLPAFYSDCSFDLICPCCTFCCKDGVGCECRYLDTDYEFLC